jgi:hypothetical protein
MLAVVRVMGTVFFRMRLVMTFAFHMLRTRFAQATTVLTLRYRPAFLVDMYEWAIC